LEKVKSEIFKIGWYQVIGGVIAIFIIFSQFYKVEFTTRNIFALSFMLIFFVYSVLCGILCLKLNKGALQYSLINQLFQFLGFALLGIIFKYVAGLYLTIGLDLTKSIDIPFGFGVSKMEFAIKGEPERVEIDFNLVAFGLIYWIDKLKRKIKIDREIAEIQSIGTSN
jgi:hypothetical protein